MKCAQKPAFKRSIIPLCLLAGMGVLAGCASTPPVPERGYSQSARQQYSRKRAYNRPYTVRGQIYYPLESAQGYSEIGMASWYGSESGSTTSMGTQFNPDDLTAAHKTLPLPSKIRVTNLLNGQSAILIVNDRGPFHPGRLIDLSRGAARKIGMAGLTRVKIDYLGFP